MNRSETTIVGDPVAKPAPKHRDKLENARKPQHEIEFKLNVPEVSSRAVMARLEDAGPVSTTLLNAHYYDTPDDRLDAAGVSIRLRQEEGRWVQTLKARAGGRSNFDREEHEVELRVKDAATPTIDLWLHAGTPPGRTLFEALDVPPDPAALPTLIKRYGTRIVRHSVRVDVGSSTIEVAFHQGHIDAGLHSVPVNELELELKAGNTADLLHATKAWLRLGLHVQPESKAQRGLRLLHGIPTIPPQKANVEGVSAATSPDRFARSVISACLAQIFPNASVVGNGAYSEDHVHQLRIGLRRMRTALRELPRLSEGLPVMIERPLAKVFQMLGAHRDQMTVLASIKRKLLAAGAKGVGWAECTSDADVDLASAVNGRGFQMALLRALAYAEGATATDLAPKRVVVKMKSRVKRLHRQVSDQGRRFNKLSEVEQHDVRKRLKRLRYLSEFAEPLFGAEAVQRYLEALKPAQDSLGLHNDGAVAHALAKRAARHDRDARFAVRWLDQESERTARKARKKLRRVRNARPFWERSGARSHLSSGASSP